MESREKLMDFYLRDKNRDLMNVEGVIMEDIYNIIAEAKAIMQEAHHCSPSGQDKIII